MFLKTDRRKEHFCLSYVTSTTGPDEGKCQLITFMANK